MKAVDLVKVGLAYLCAVTIVYFIARRFEEDAAGMAQAGGTTLAVSIAAWLYQLKSEHKPSFAVKLSVGAMLALLCVAQSLTFQRLFGWMQYPDISIVLGALGALVFPFLFWNTFSGAFGSKARTKTKANEAQDASEPPIPRP